MFYPELWGQAQPWGWKKLEFHPDLAANSTDEDKETETPDSVKLNLPFFQKVPSQGRNSLFLATGLFHCIETIY